mgnify:CR=1 FL=1
MATAWFASALLENVGDWERSTGPFKLSHTALNRRGYLRVFISDYEDGYLALIHYIFTPVLFMGPTFVYSPVLLMIYLCLGVFHPDVWELKPYAKSNHKVPGYNEPSSV